MKRRHPDRVTMIYRVESELRAALDLSRWAGCPRLSAKIRSALKSAGGAIRHAEHMEDRRRQVS